VLVELDGAEAHDVQDAIVDASLVTAPKRVAATYLADRAADDQSTEA
jgi:hypothetical protein